MKDFLGNELIVGDQVIFTLNGRFKGLLTGKIIMIDHLAHVQLDIDNWMMNRPMPFGNENGIFTLKPNSIYKID